MTQVQSKLAWWKDAIVYQIYPATFKDSTGSGTGDLQGVIDKLGYIASLGVNTIWISPFYKSPQKDLGYDIADYTAVHEPYGHVKDVETIIAESKKLGMRVLADLVINHCSDEHEWFKEARKSKDSPKRDWFIWKPAKMVDGKRKEPNNWRCAFGGPTWTWDEGTQEYYFHTFLSGQPDLNWENLDCRQAIFDDSIKFWLDRGLAGFRVDTVNMYSKNTAFPDAPIVNKDTELQPCWDFVTNGPRLHEYLKDMRKSALGDAVTIGELPNTPDWRDVLKYVAADVKELDMVIQFDIASLSHRGWSLMETPWKLSELKHYTYETQRLADPANGAWACNYMGNHDQGRAVSRFASGDPEFRTAGAKMLAAYLLTLSGTPIVYQGDEIGMVNIGKDRAVRTEYKDCDSIGFLAEAEEAAERNHHPELVELAIKGIQLNGRDHARTPVQWDNSKNGGFSTADECWMRANDSYKEGLNVAEQEKDPKSVLAYYRKLIELRKANAGIFTHGKYIPEEDEKDDENVFIYTKECRDSGKKAVVVLNWSKSAQKYKLPAAAEGMKVSLDSGDAGAEGELTPYAAKIYM